MRRKCDLSAAKWHENTAYAAKAGIGCRVEDRELRNARYKYACIYNRRIIAYFAEYQRRLQEYVKSTD
ncbi:hypothetical protein ACFL4W_03305 [Planctomycetota bacterium]